MKKYLLTGTGLLLFTLFLNEYVSSGKPHIFNTEDTISHIIESRVDYLPDVSMYRVSDVQGKFGPVLNICSGINIHFTKGHERDLDMIAAAGFKFIRMDLIWEETENTKGTYNWTAYDELTANLNKRGLRAIYILDYSNSLYEDSAKFKDTL